MKIKTIFGIFLALLTTPALAEIKGADKDSALADAISPLVAAADRTLQRLPDVHLTSDLIKQCGAGRGSNPFVLYCSSENRIFIATGTSKALGAGAARYLLGHVYGHAAQVRYGVADIALSTIRANRDREVELRGYVTRQVECVAGVLNNRAGGLSAGPADWFTKEPLADSHWGATPIRRGPVVSIGLAERDAWFRKGLKSGDFADCSAGDFPADLLVKAAQ